MEARSGEQKRAVIEKVTAKMVEAVGVPIERDSKVPLEHRRHEHQGSRTLTKHWLITTRHSGLRRNDRASVYS